MSENEGTSNAIDHPSTRIVPELRGGADLPPEPQNFGPSPTFGALTLLLDILQAERKIEKRKQMVERWFQLWRLRVGPNLYPALRLILPKQDKERAVYHSKESNIAKALIGAMGIEQAPDAVKLLNWRRPPGHERSVAGDFPGLAYEVVAKRSSVTQGSLRIDQVNDLLDELSKRGGKLENQKLIFSQLFNKCTAAEIRWIIKIILKDLNAGAKETTILNVFHPDALALFNSSSDLKRVSYELWDPSHRLDDSEKAVQVFRTFAPMLAKRPPKHITDAVKRFGGITFKVEEKLDGERIQLHKRGSQYYYCSRKGKDYTYLYGKQPGIGSLTPYIHASFNPDVQECILDGEMLVWDPISARYLPFGTLKSHAGENAEKRQYSPRPCFKVFDLIYLNGKSLTHESMSYRRRNLKNVFDPVEGRLEIMDQKDASTATDVQNLLREVIESRGEGLILKHPNSVYVLNGRLDHWIKIKPEYMDGEGETLDLLVIGGNFGTGWRGGGVSTLICGVLDDGPAASDGEPKWSSFCRIGSGLSFADFIGIRAKPWIDWGSKGPSFFQTAPRSQDDKGDVYLKPEDSFLITVKAAEISGSDQYHMKFTLRFPRAIRIREEFDFRECAKASDILERLVSDRKRKQEDESGNANKKRKLGAGRKKAIVSSAFQGSKQEESEITSDLFAGKSFAIYPTTQANQPYSKPDLERKVRENGGTIRARRSRKPEEVLVYDGKNQPPDIKAIIRDGEQNIVRPSWILDCIKKKRLLPLRAKYLYHSVSHQDSDTELSGDDDEQTEDEQAEDKQTENEPQVKQEPESQPVVDIETPATRSQGDSQQLVQDMLANNPNSDWVKVEPQDTLDFGGPVAEPSDEETEHEEPGDEDTDPEEWTDLFMGGDATQSTPAKVSKDSIMGQSEDAMEYDQINFFKHLVFYLDSPSCARRNGMNVSTSHESAIEARFTEVSKEILAYGGQITTQIYEPKLTHVVMDNADLSRRIALMRMTEKPKRRRFVLTEFIHYCVEEKTLANEDEFMP